LADEGITFNVQYAAEVWSNVTGGESTGTVYTGLMTLQGNVDLQKLLGWQGASVSTRWYWLSGQDISATNLGNNIFTVSNIAGFPTFRMSELWIQQNFMNDRIRSALGSWRPIPSSVSPSMRLSFSMDRLHGHPISLQTSQMEALHILWVRRVCNCRLRL
jgi:carbohydrate-selective porin OprB